jgi:hypothetical protein
MKIGLSIAIGAIFAAASVSAGAQELRIVAELTIGEKSKDSSSQTTVITVNDDEAVWEQTISGMRPGSERERVERKRFQLSLAERKRLIHAITANELQSVTSLTLPLRPPVFYFDLRIHLTLGDARGAIAIVAPRSAAELRENKLYARSMNLVKELYRALNTRDANIVFDEPLRPTR